MRNRAENRKPFSRKSLLSVLPVWLICCMLAGAAEMQEQEAVPIYFFHNTACGACDGTEEFRETVEEQISGYQDVCPYELLEYNVFKTGGKEVWDAVAGEYQLENESYIFPVMILDGMMYPGMQEIREQLLPAFLEASGVSALYFYREDCPECLDMEPFWEQFSEVLENGQGEDFCQVLKLESRTGDNGEQIRQLFELYGVPEEDQMVPIVFLKDGYLAGQKEIEEKLMPALEKGRGFFPAEDKTGGTEDEVMVSETGGMLE